LITEYFLGLAVTVGNFFLDLIPDWSIPDFFLTLDTQLNSFAAAGAGMGVWVPWPLVIACTTISLGSWVIGLSVKAVRALLGHVPQIGGNG
jgi:hypothetical protein